MCPCGIVANVLECKIVESEFELHLRNYIHFWINSLGKSMNLFHAPR